MASQPANSRNYRQLAFWSAGLLAIIAAFALDGMVDGWVYRPIHDTGWKIAFALSKIGDWPPILLAGLVVVAGLVSVRKVAAGQLVLLILLAGLLTGLGGTVIRTVTGRTRPLAEAPQGFYGLRYQGHWIAGKYEFGSFPSGHTACWAGLAGAAWFRQRRLALAFLGVGVAVAWSRLALGCHHFSDVIASMVWGLGVGMVIADWMERVLGKFKIQNPKSNLANAG